MPGVRPQAKQVTVPVGGLQWSAVAAGVVAAFVVSLVAAGVIVLVVYTTTVSEHTASTFLFAAGLLSLGAAAGYGARLAGTLGWVHGLAIGVGYVIVTMVLSPLLFPGGMTVGGSAVRLAVGAALGALGGVLGVNL